MQANIFFRRENKNFKPQRILTDRFEVEVTAQPGTDQELGQILNSVWNQGASRGSHRSGIFEIQTDLGIWSQINEKKLNPSRMQLTRYQSWDQLISEETK